MRSSILIALILVFVGLYLLGQSNKPNEQRGCIASAYQSTDVEENLAYCDKLFQ